jgi:predicted ATPase
MGKSRLVAGVESDARALGYAWSWTESVSYGRGEPYRFGRQFAQVIADEHDTDSGSHARTLLFRPGTDEAAMRRYGGAIAAIARDAAFSGWEAEAVDVPDDPAEVTALLSEVAAAYIERMLDMDGPRVVVLDDLHWLDTSSNGMVELLIATAASRPLVILATTRPGAIPTWATLDHVERIDLDGLAPAETAQLATIVARAALDAGDARRIHERTQGNPLFIGETVRASLEDGSLELRDGRMVLTEPSTPRLPLTLRAVLGARLDGLDAPTRDVLSVASVIGIRFGLTELEDLLDEPIPTGALDRLVDASLVVPSARNETWRFSHPLVHEAAYAGMLASRRRRLHARLADRLAARPPVAVEAMAVHRAAAGDATAAIPLLEEAATTALAVGAPTEAAAFWRNAAELATEPEEIARFRASADAALEAARGQAPLRRRRES